MDLKIYDQRLRNHDWEYRESDSLPTYQEGKASETLLAHTSEESPEHKKLYEAWKSYNARIDKISLAEVDAVRIEVGVVTYEEVAVERTPIWKRTISQLDEEMRLHDWTYYQSSTDSSVYQLGLAERKKLTAAARHWPQWGQLFYAHAKFARGEISAADLDIVRNSLGMD